MIYLCENDDCQRRMETIFLSMTIEQPMSAFPEKTERRAFAFCSRKCFAEFCHGVVYRGSPIAIHASGYKEYTAIPASIDYPLVSRKAEASHES